MSQRRERGPTALLLAIAGTLALAGCGSYPKEDPAVADAAALPVTCNTREDCAAKWMRAQQWVAAHSTRPTTIQGTTLTTTGPPPSVASPVFSVVLSQRSATEATFAFSADCRSDCKPPEQTLLGDFNLYLSATNPTPLTPMKAAKP